MMKNKGSVPGRPLRADARQNRKDLLAAARELFASEGPEASLEEIARRAGVGIGTLYRNFPGRYELIQDMYSEQMQELVELADTLASSSTPGEALFEWLRAESRSIATCRPLKIFLMNDSGAKRPTAVNWKEKLAEVGGTLLKRAQKSGEVRNELSTHELLHLVHAVIIAADNSGPDKVDELLEVVIDGLRSRRS